MNLYQRGMSADWFVDAECIPVACQRRDANYSEHPRKIFSLNSFILAVEAGIHLNEGREEARQIIGGNAVPAGDE